MAGMVGRWRDDGGDGDGGGDDGDDGDCRGRFQTCPYNIIDLDRKSLYSVYEKYHRIH